MSKWPKGDVPTNKNLGTRGPRKGLRVPKTHRNAISRAWVRIAEAGRRALTAWGTLVYTRLPNTAGKWIPFGYLKSRFQHGLEMLRQWISGAALCSDCFVDHGLAIEARNLGHKSRRLCRSCHSATGAKLYRSDIEELARRYFVYGTRIRTEFGGAPILQFNSWHHGKPGVSFPIWLEADARLIENALGVGLFYYAPPLWRIGEIEPLADLRNPVTRSAAASALVSKFPRRLFTAGSSFYRLRSDITEGAHSEQLEYDAPPKGIGGNGRLDAPDFPVLYGSQDLEICVHECRITITDECYLAVLRACRDLHLLDLCADIEDDGKTPFESLYLAVQFIFAAEKHGYEITRTIAATAKDAGLHGIIYPSYFSPLRQERIPNLALFGHPVADGIVKVDCINRLTLETARYTVRLGPCLSRD
jgi:RES domain